MVPHGMVCTAQRAVRHPDFAEASTSACCARLSPAGGPWPCVCPSVDAFFWRASGAGLGTSCLESGLCVASGAGRAARATAGRKALPHCPKVGAPCPSTFCLSASAPATLSASAPPAEAFAPAAWDEEGSALPPGAATADGTKVCCTCEAHSRRLKGIYLYFFFT